MCSNIKQMLYSVTSTMAYDVTRAINILKIKMS